MAVAGVGELVVGRGELLEALCSDRSKVSFKLSILGENHRPTSDEAVDQILLSHFVWKKRGRETNPNAPEIRY